MALRAWLPALLGVTMPGLMTAPISASEAIPPRFAPPEAAAGAAVSAEPAPSALVPAATDRPVYRLVWIDGVHREAMAWIRSSEPVPQGFPDADSCLDEARSLVERDDRPFGDDRRAGTLQAYCLPQDDATLPAFLWMVDRNLVTRHSLTTLEAMVARADLRWWQERSRPVQRIPTPYDADPTGRGRLIDPLFAGPPTASAPGPAPSASPAIPADPAGGPAPVPDAAAPAPDDAGGIEASPLVEGETTADRPVAVTPPPPATPAPTPPAAPVPVPAPPRATEDLAPPTPMVAAPEPGPPAAVPAATEPGTVPPPADRPTAGSTASPASPPADPAPDGSADAAAPSWAVIISPPLPDDGPAASGPVPGDPWGEGSIDGSLPDVPPSLDPLGSSAGGSDAPDPVEAIPDFRPDPAQD